MKRNPLLYLSMLLLLGILLPSRLFAVTYQYSPAPAPQYWYNANSQGAKSADGEFYYDPRVGESVTLPTVKMLLVGTLHITDMPENANSGFSMITTTQPIDEVVVKGPFTGEEIRKQKGVDSLDEIGSENLMLAMEYHTNGKRGGYQISGTATTNKTIHLYPAWHQTSLDVNIYLIITLPVKMEEGTRYPIENLSGYRFKLTDEDGQAITGDGLMAENNAFTGNYNPSTDSQTEGQKPEPVIDALFSVLSYPERTELTSGSTIDLPPDAERLSDGYPLLYLQTDFTSKNTGGTTKSLQVSITHDQLAPQGKNSNPSYAYQLSLTQDLSSGTVETVYDQEGKEDGTGKLAYRLTGSSAGDMDRKRLDFTLPEGEGFASAIADTYLSTVTITMTVE